MKRFFGAIKRFFLPPADAKTFTRVLPLIAVAFLMIVLFTAATFAWEESNSTAFCGVTCHTMPPEYVTHAHSSHTNVTCEDCHMGRDRLGVMIERKVRYSWQTGSAMLLNNYEFPIVARNMAPAREACENCHKPEVFASDTLRETRRFAEDEDNTATTIYLAVKTGGGSRRQGLGFGIHWHIENPVYFYATDSRQQQIPYVLVENEDGSRTEYIDIEAGFDPASIDENDLVQMDCITCHNRTAHLVDSPSQTLDELMQRNLVSPEIPGIKQQAVAIMSAEYASVDEAKEAIAGLSTYYQQQHANFAGEAENQALIDRAVTALQEAWERTNFPAQEVNWQTHPDNLAHRDSPGCFRCHDGKHLNAEQEAVRLECNLCHSIPVVSDGSQLTANLELSRGFEPDSHKNPNWITLHREIFDASCEGCHTVDDPGGVSNTSFCSNSACHGASWEFAGFDAPALRAALAGQLEAVNGGDTGGEEGGESGAVEGPLSYTALQPLFEGKCGACHGAAAMAGLNVTTYESLMAGGDNGPVVASEDSAASLLVQIQQEGGHPGMFAEEELVQVIQWIEEGAVEE